MRALIVTLSLLLPGLGHAKRVANPVTQNCGAEPKNDPAHTAGIKRQERLLDRLLTTRSRVFRAYRHQYDEKRERIIARNSKLPKSQHMEVPPPMTDDELRATEEYRRREKKAHASPAEERALRAKKQVEVDELATAQKKYEACRKRILDRIRTAGSKSAEAILKIPKDERLAEENHRLVELEEEHGAKLQAKRKNNATMRPIISASLCAHRNLLRDTRREIKVLERAAKNRDVRDSLEAAKERSEEHSLEITELKRDMKLHKIRAQRCNKRIEPLVECIEAHRRTAGRTEPPTSCKSYHDELELLGYYKRSWE